MQSRLRGMCLLLTMLLLVGCIGAEKPQNTAVETPSAAPAPTDMPVVEIVLDEKIAETVQPIVLPTPTATPAPEVTPTPTPTPSPTPVPSPFGILWIPDTQGLSYSHPDKLETLGAEIAARRESEGLIAVVHTGDIVDNGYKDWEWDNFDLCLSAFSEDLPFYPVAGNHDLGVNLQQYTAYLKRPFLELLPAEQMYEGGKMYYVVLNENTAAELLLLCVGWDCGKTKQEQAWLDSVFEQIPKTPCILVTHGLLKPDGTVFPTMRYLENDIVAKYPNVRLVICGHSRGSSIAEHTFDDDGDDAPDRTVTMLMLNRQSGSFAYRVLLFDPISREIEVRTYELGKDAVLEKDEDWPLSFTIQNAF